MFSAELLVPWKMPYPLNKQEMYHSQNQTTQKVNMFYFQ